MLAVKRLHENKNHIQLIRANRQLAGNLPDWRLRIVGERELRADLEQAVRVLDLEGRVELAGTIRVIDQKFLSAQLVVVPSRYEGFGLVTGEALSFGLPVIGFADCPGTNDLIEDGVNGTLVAAGDRVANLAAALSSLMADGGKRAKLGTRGPESVGDSAPRWWLISGSSCSETSRDVSCRQSKADRAPNSLVGYYRGSRVQHLADIMATAKP